MALKDVVEWESKDTQIVLEKEDDFSLMLKIMVSKNGKDAFKPDHVLVTCLNTIEWYLAHENLHSRTLDHRLQTMQEILYYAIGRDFELSGERDKLMLFIHNNLPHLLMGSLIGFKIAKDFYQRGNDFNPFEAPKNGKDNEKDGDKDEDEEEEDEEDEDEEDDDDEEDQEDEEDREDEKVEKKVMPRKRFCWC
jgi:hypothetical protein